MLVARILALLFHLSLVLPSMKKFLYLLGTALAAGFILGMFAYITFFMLWYGMPAMTP